jgi:hypothetical protein
MKCSPFNRSSRRIPIELKRREVRLSGVENLFILLR